MIEQYVNPANIRPVAPLSPLAKAFETALMEVEIGPEEEGSDAIEEALADAVFHYSLIGLCQRTIVKKLVDQI